MRSLTHAFSLKEVSAVKTSHCYPNVARIYFIDGNDPKRWDTYGKVLEVSKLRKWEMGFLKWDMGFLETALLNLSEHGGSLKLTCTTDKELREGRPLIQLKTENESMNIYLLSKGKDDHSKTFHYSHRLSHKFEEIPQDKLKGHEALGHRTRL